MEMQAQATKLVGVLVLSHGNQNAQLITLAEDIKNLKERQNHPAFIKKLGYSIDGQ